VRDHEPSMTAKVVAAQRAGFVRLDAPYGESEADDRLQRDVAHGAPAPNGAMTAYLRSRTEFFDRFVVDAITDGVQQLVAVGAGYDGRSLRYAKSDVHWFELDHPDTQADKRKRLDQLHIATPGVVFVALDFSRDELRRAVKAAGFDPYRPAAFLCEGVSSYLEREVLNRLLSDLAELAAPNSSLAMTMLVRGNEVARESGQRLGDATAALGEPLLTVLDRTKVRELIEQAGWSISCADDFEGLPIETSDRGAALIKANRSR
jgi:methyltransferase (TIGR00027 family)